MPLSLLPVTSPADIPTLTHLHLDAFIRIPINHAIWPHGITDNVLGHAETSHRKALDADPSARYLKVVDDDTSAIIAFARWHVFATPEAESQRWDLKPRDWGKDVDLDVAGAFWVEIVRARRRMEGKAHCFLALLATHASHNRRGAGAMLVKWGVDEADRLDLPCFLESSPYGVGLYKKFGFREIGAFEMSIAKECFREDWVPEKREGVGGDGGEGQAIRKEETGETEVYRHVVMIRDARPDVQDWLEDRKVER